MRGVSSLTQAEAGVDAAAGEGVGVDEEDDDDDPGDEDPDDVRSNSVERSAEARRRVGRGTTVMWQRLRDVGSKARCRQGRIVVPARLLHDEDGGVAGLLTKENITLKMVCGQQDEQQDGLVSTGQDSQRAEQSGNVGEYKARGGVNCRLMLQPECCCFCSSDLGGKRCGRGSTGAGCVGELNGWTGADNVSAESRGAVSAVDMCPEEMRQRDHRKIFVCPMLAGTLPLIGPAAWHRQNLHQLDQLHHLSA